MNSIKCFDVAKMVIEEATNRFAPIFKEVSERKDTLQQYCEAIDDLCNQFGGISYEVEVDEIAMTISIRVDCTDIHISGNNKTFLQLAERAITIAFAPGENSKNIIMEFVFPSIWENRSLR